MQIRKLTAPHCANIYELMQGIFSSLASEEYGTYRREYDGNERKITVYCGEEYYFRNDSTLMLTAIVEETPESVSVEIVSGGGKTGLFGISWGAEKNAVKNIVRVLTANGFAESHAE